jgi:hypothetical protein
MVMDELEQRLRSALTEMAEEVPPSHHAWAEQERRLAGKRPRRRPVLMAAAAAAVVVMIAVPLLVVNMRGARPVDHAAPPDSPTTSVTTPTVPTSESRDPQYRPQAGETVLTQPVLLISGEPEGKNESTYLYTIRRAGMAMLCTQERPRSNGMVLDMPGNCVQVSPPRPGKYVWMSIGVPTVSSKIFVYLASPPTERIMVRRAEGNIVVAAKLASGPEFGVFSVYLGSTQSPTAYTAKDPANVSLEDG